MSENLAPIVLFVYNRPEHTKQTLEALVKNDLAKDSILYVFADGKKVDVTPENEDRIDAVQQLIANIQGFKQVELRISHNNKGLYRSIREGVSEVIDKYGKVIVLEDDLVTSPAFLSYMNSSLTFYERYPAVFSITGYNYPPQKMRIPENYSYDTYASLRNGSWSWATWKSRWDKVDWEVKAFEVINNTPAIKSALNRMGDDEFDLLQMQQSGELNIWSIQFTIAHFVNHAVAIYPTVSYVDNIGNDGSGQNCGCTATLSNATLSMNYSPRFLDVVYEDSRIINAFYNINCRKKRPLWQKIINRCFRLCGKESPFVLKGKIYNK